MSLIELKEHIADLTPRERFEIEVFLADLESAREGEFREEVDRRMQAMDRGEKITAAEFEQRDQELRRRGK